jgi:hypothetical protein
VLESPVRHLPQRTGAIRRHDRHNSSSEETDDPLYADRRNFYKVERWSKDDMRVVELLYAGNNLDKARHIFERAIKHRPRIRLMLVALC